MSEKANKTETAETSKTAETVGASLSGLSRPSGLGKTDSPIATAIFAREAVRAGIARAYRPLDVHSCPVKWVRIAHNVLEWVLNAWAVVIVVQIVLLVKG